MIDKSTKLIDTVDKDLHDSILRLDQKLKGLQAEIEVKRQVETEEIRKEKLNHLAEEVGLAIEGIKELVNLVVSEEFNQEEFLQMNRESLESLRDLFKDNIEQLAKLKETF